MKDEMKIHSRYEYTNAVWNFDFLAWGKSRRKVYDKIRRVARRRMKHKLNNMNIYDA